MSLIVKAGKAGKRFLKAAHILPEEVPHVSYTRRIERVKTPERICAMTFDDGPMDMPAAPDQFHGRALTDLILDALAEFDAKGTFDVIGDTSMNYPDEAGKEGSAAWGGIRYDHYPDIHQDQHGGVVHNDRLIRRMLSEGHQITNHGYRHILFGKKPFVYGKRVHYGSVHSAVGDLRRLDLLMREQYNYAMTMGRPPHYVDGLNGGFTSYDVYDRMGYQYLAASFDGAGWLPLGRKEREALEAEIIAMTAPMRDALQKDPDFFCGQIIFQKDGYNMARRTPVAWGLPLQLEILHQYGYQVVTVQELMEECPFADVGRDSPLFEKLARLAKRRGIAYSDNNVRLDKYMTMGELAMLLAPPDEAMDLRWTRMRRTKRREHPYYGAVNWCKRERILPRDTNPDAPVTSLPHGIFDSVSAYTRRAVYEAFREDWIDQGEYQESEIKRIEEELHGWIVPPLPPAQAETPTETSSPDAQTETPTDAQTDEPSPDAETEIALEETPTEPSPDAETEIALEETPTEPPADAQTEIASEETPAEPSADAETEIASEETPAEPSADAQAEIPVEASTDTPAEPSTDAETEIPVEASTDTPIEPSPDAQAETVESPAELRRKRYKVDGIPHLDNIPYVDNIPNVLDDDMDGDDEPLMERNG